MAVIEEVLHLGQHRRMRWALPSGQQIATLEIEAQKRLLRLGRRKGWTRRELRRFKRAHLIWMARR